VRIFYLTGLPGYRKASYQGVIWGAVALFGIALTIYTLELVGLGVILAALYLQGRVKREKIWKEEGTWERMTGRVRSSR